MNPEWIAARDAGVTEEIKGCTFVRGWVEQFSQERADNDR